MTITVRDVLAAARAYHPGFDERNSSNAALIPLLDVYQRTLYSKVLLRLPGFTNTPAEYSFSATLFEDGAGLIPLAINEVRIEEAGTFREIPIRPLGQVPYSTGRFCWLENSRLYLSGELNDWNGVTTVRVYYVAQLTSGQALTTLDSELVLPDNAQPACVAHIAMRLAQRTPEDEGPGAGAFADEAARAELDFLDSLILLDRAEVSTWVEDDR